MTAHLVALPHTRIDDDFLSCAYTQKVAKFARMDVGRDVIIYGPEGPDLGVAETVAVWTDSDRLATFGPDDASKNPAWPTAEQFRLYNILATAEIAKRAEPGDLLLLAGGYDQKAIADTLPHLISCEPFVGYPGIFADRCAFESNAWRHHVYGKHGIEDGRWWDAVIPNYFDVDDFDPAASIRTAGSDYLVFLGRVTLRKGPAVAAEIAKKAGMKLIVAGTGASQKFGKIVGDGVVIEGDLTEVEYVGPVGIAERAELLTGARALIAPTLYVEPFGGVAVEAMLCGTPAITTDWGAFAETVEPGKTGYRFTNMAEAVYAVEAAGELDRLAVREEAIARFSLEAVGPLFASWFDRLETLNRAGWYEERRGVRV